MGFLLAAAPYEEFVRENSPILAILVVLLIAALVVRLVVKTMTRVILLSLLTLMALFVMIERDNVRECTETCECDLAGFHVEVPACDPAVLRRA